MFGQCQANDLVCGVFWSVKTPVCEDTDRGRAVCEDSGLCPHHSRQVNKLNVFTFAIKKDGRTERITENDRRFKIEQ